MRVTFFRIELCIIFVPLCVCVWVIVRMCVSVFSAFVWVGVTMCVTVSESLYLEGVSECVCVCLSGMCLSFSDFVSLCTFNCLCVSFCWCVCVCLCVFVYVCESKDHIEMTYYEEQIKLNNQNGTSRHAGSIGEYWWK